MQNAGFAPAFFVFSVIASGAKQSRAAKKSWIASSQVLLAMTLIFS